MATMPLRPTSGSHRLTKRDTLKTNLTQSRKDAKNHANNTVIEHEDAGQTRFAHPTIRHDSMAAIGYSRSSFLRLCGLA